MGTSSFIATTLDIEMLGLRGLKIAPGHTDIRALPEMDGSAFAALIPRHLMRYVRSHQVGGLTSGTTSPQYVTLTPYSGDEAVAWLALPGPMNPPSHVLLLDPAQMAGYRIVGPRWVRLGKGVEFVLIDGFPVRAIVPPGWEVEVK